MHERCSSDLSHQNVLITRSHARKPALELRPGQDIHTLLNNMPRRDPDVLIAAVKEQLSLRALGTHESPHEYDGVKDEFHS